MQHHEAAYDAFQPKEMPDGRASDTLKDPKAGHVFHDVDRASLKACM